MHFTKTEINEKPLKNCYQVIFSYGHGDADADTTNTEVFYNKTEEQMLNYFKKFNEVADAIYAHNCQGQDLPEELKHTNPVIEGMDITLEYDLYGKSTFSDTFANMGIDKIYYYDNEGKKFEYKFVE